MTSSAMRPLKTEVPAEQEALEASAVLTAPIWVIFSAIFSAIYLAAAEEEEPTTAL